MIYIGDVHGKYGPYKQIIKDCQASIQVGDMGVGFFRSDGRPHTNPPFDHMTKNGRNHRFIRGNHDNPDVCSRHKQWIPDGSLEGDHMFIGGAFSIDKAYRTAGLDWWPDEELSWQRLCDMALAAKIHGPRVIVSHDCPKSIIQHMHSHHLFDNSRTQEGLQLLYEEWQPEYWIYGHHHKSFKYKEGKTTFICLAELEVLEL